MRLLNHPNVVHLKHYFYSTTDKNEVYLNLVLEFVPETVYRASRHYSRGNQYMPILYVQLYTYQVHSFGFSNRLFSSLLQHHPAFCIMLRTLSHFGFSFLHCNHFFLFFQLQICRALNYMHKVIGVCHRDIKPQNLLV